MSLVVPNIGWVVVCERWDDDGPAVFSALRIGQVVGAGKSDDGVCIGCMVDFGDGPEFCYFHQVRGVVDWPPADRLLHLAGAAGGSDSRSEAEAAC